jgi:hypothetical protein
MASLLFENTIHANPIVCATTIVSGPIIASKAEYDAVAGFDIQLAAHIDLTLAILRNVEIDVELFDEGRPKGAGKLVHHPSGIEDVDKVVGKILAQSDANSHLGQPVKCLAEAESDDINARLVEVEFDALTDIHVGAIDQNGNL